MCTSSREYQDILKKRRNECSNFIWASRSINPKVAYECYPQPTPEFHKNEVLNSRKIQDLLQKLSLELDTPVKELEKSVRLILDEIGYKKNLKLIRWLGYVLVKICMKINPGIYVNETEIFDLKSKMGQCPVIFVPSHRSYADFILMSLMLFTYDIVIPAIAAGMDFHGMWAMGTMLRNTGAFFMRRTYNDDNLYWTTFKQYVLQLVTKGELPIEFFIEGTRSRSGKSLTPKFGLILMILKAYFLSLVPDILFVPINITYSRVLEEKLFACELLGIPKPKETTSGFFKSLSIVKENYGKIYFDFSKPISVREFFKNSHEQRLVHNQKGIHQQELTDDEKNLIPSLAYEIVYKQQKHSIITPFNLIAIILDNNLTYGYDLLHLNDLIEQISWLKTIMNEFGAYVDLKNPEIDILEDLNVHQNIVGINNKGQITLIWNDMVFTNLTTTVLKGHGLKEKTINFSMPFIMLQIYINPVLHYLIDSAILVIILKYFKNIMPQNELFENYHFLRSLLSQEFVIFPPKEQMEFELALKTSLKLNVIQTNNDGLYQLGNNKKLQNVLSTLLDCFIYTYFVACSVLLQSHDSYDENILLAKIQEEIEIGLDDDKLFIHPYCLSLDTITNCLSTLSTSGVLQKNRRNNITSYQADQTKLFIIKNKLEHYIPSSQVMQRKLENVQLHLKNKL